MAKRSAGVLLYRHGTTGPEVLLVHPGGPFWAKKDAGAWSIPKGEIDEGEGAEEAARREFLEETGVALEGELLALGEFRQPSGKRVLAFALEGECDPSRIRSNTCRVDWPPGTGRTMVVPEVDRAAWFPLPEAASKILPGQRGVLEALKKLLGGP